MQRHRLDRLPNSRADAVTVLDHVNVRWDVEQPVDLVSVLPAISECHFVESSGPLQQESRGTTSSVHAEIR